MKYKSLWFIQSYLFQNREKGAGLGGGGQRGGKLGHLLIVSIKKKFKKRVNPQVQCGLWVIMICQCKFIHGKEIKISL